MAHVLEEDNTVTEMYLSNGNIQDSKNLLMVHKDGTIELEWCLGDTIQVEENPILVKIGRRMVLEYGTPNLFGVREMMPFQDEQGNLESRWERIM